MNDDNVFPLRDVYDDPPAATPHSIEAEQSVIGALFLSDAALDEVRGELVVGDFYSGAHRMIFEHVVALAAKAIPIDVTTVSESLERAGKLDYVGGLIQLGRLIANVPTAANARHYAKIVHDRAELRRIAGDALEIHRAATSPIGADTETVRADLVALFRRMESTNKPRRKLQPRITPEEFATAPLSPDCIVENYLYADVAIIPAPGGVGKTTLLLYEAVHIVLGLPLYGQAVRKPGPVLFVTAEDPRKRLVARLRCIAYELQLDAEQTAIVLRDVRIEDVSGECFKLTQVAGDVVIASPDVDGIIDACSELQPVLIVFDPAVSFGVGEQRVNDAEQGLIEAARRIRNAIGCCVRYVHHSGKENARNKTVDQYTGRGGSALPDGCRMVAVLQELTPEAWRKATGASLLTGEQGMVLARPKVSYCPPNQPDILITRKGFAFAFTSRAEPDAAADLEANCRQVIQLIETAIAKGERPSKSSLEALSAMPRDDMRGAVAMLLSQGRIVKAKTPHKGGQQEYLAIQGSPDQTREASRKKP